MSFRKRHRRKSPVKSTTKNKLNLQVIVLTAISCLFCWSLLSHLLSDEPNPETTIVDLDELITINSYEEKTSHRITVEILNGCGQPNAANMYQNFLRHRGYDVWSIGNAKRGDYESSKILYHSQDYHDSTGLRTIDMANYLSEETMGINNSFIIGDSDKRGYDLTLIIGHDFKELSSFSKARKYYKKF